jgi:hypothetical protein
LPEYHTERRKMEVHKPKAYITNHKGPGKNTQKIYPYKTYNQLEECSSLQIGKNSSRETPNKHSLTVYIQCEKHRSFNKRPK